MNTFTTIHTPQATRNNKPYTTIQHTTAETLGNVRECSGMFARFGAKEKRFGKPGSTNPDLPLQRKFQILHSSALF